MHLYLRCVKIFFLILPASLLPLFAAAETTTTKTISHYMIEGRTADELDEALAAQGPTSSQSGMRHPGITKINFGGDITFTTTLENCAVDSVNVTLSTNIELPRWKNRRKANQDLAVSWDALSADIKRHEERHAEIARQYAKKLDETLIALLPAKTCDILQAHISEATQKIMNEHDADQERFDRVERKNFDARLERMIRERKGTSSE